LFVNIPKQSNDIDLVTYTVSKSSKGPAPKPKPLPEFKPLVCNASEESSPNIPDGIDSSDPEALFDMFFDKSIIEMIVKATNQNAQLKRTRDRRSSIREHQRPWHPVTFDELRAYLGIITWMSCQPLKSLVEYWNTQKENGAVFDIIRESMGLERWSQIDRYFHVFLPSEHPLIPKPRPFDKVEPLAKHLRKCFHKFMTAGINVAIDECIQGFDGRASEIVNIPTKPTPIGFKIWVLAIDGYVLDFMWHACGSKSLDGPQNLDPQWQKLGFSATQSVVLTLICQMENQGRGHVVWIDNLFTSGRLLKTLRELEIGSAGTVRTRREEIEEQTQTKVAKKGSKNKPLAEKNRGLNQSIADIKIKHNTKIPWGQLYAETSEENQFAWKDSQVVLFMSTVHDGKGTVLRNRKRPKNATPLVKETWGNKYEMKLYIPDFINGYNYSMNGVDLADQSRQECPTKRPRMYRTWKPCWHYLFDTTLCNAAHIFNACGHFNSKSKAGLNLTFRKALALKLMHYNRSKPRPLCSGMRPGERTVLSKVVDQSSTSHYGQLIKGDKQECCKACQAAARQASAKRTILEGISTNRPRPPRTIYRCDQCNLALCKGGICWKDHVNAYESQ